MAKFSFALSDKLCKEYFLFKQKDATFDKSIISKLFCYYTGDEFIASVEQIERVGVAISEHLKINLKRSGYRKGTPENLVDKTEYKLILTDDKSNYPYVNINDDNINTCLTGCFYQKENRQKAIEHLKALCKDANRIVLYDKFLHENDSYLVLKDIIPNRRVEVCYVEEHLKKPCIADLTSALSNCTFTPIRDTDTQHHDRYIVIDNKIEIILSSGFEYLKESKKEIAYIVRTVKKNRFER